MTRTILIPGAALLRSGVTYANMHASKFPGGEVRRQIREPKH